MIFQGPLCRYAEDLRLMMQVLVKPELRKELRLESPVSVKDLRLFNMPDNGGGFMETAVDPELRAAQINLVKTLRQRQGLQIEDIQLEQLKHSGLMFAFHFGKLAEENDQLPVNKMATDPDHKV